MIVLAGLLGIALIFLSNALRQDKIRSYSRSSPTAAEEQSSVEDYRTQLTQELGHMLASISGVGRTKVMITLDGTEQYVYATDTDLVGRESTRGEGSGGNTDKQNNEKRSCILVKRGDGSQEPLTVGRLMPRVKGVLIVCDGGGSETVRQSVTDAVSAALDISETHICVSTLSD
jgi:stage III sporulation protein AG